MRYKDINKLTSGLLDQSSIRADLVKTDKQKSILFLFLSWGGSLFLWTDMLKENNQLQGVRPCSYSRVQPKAHSVLSTPTMVKADVSKYTFNLKFSYNMGHLDNFRYMTWSFWKSCIEQQTISKIQPGASVNSMWSSRHFDKYNLQLQQILNQA